MKLSELEKEFVADHRSTTKALSKLLDAVKSENSEQTQAAAEELDRIAGPHIAFEEQWLYPIVAQSRGEVFHRNLTDEHEEVLAALRELKTADFSHVSRQKKVEWLRQLQVGLDHVVTCGTLLSHLTALDEAQRDTLLQHLTQLRQDDTAWTSLSDQDAADSVAAGK